MRHPRGPDSSTSFHSHCGPVLGLGPLSSLPYGKGTGERANVVLRHFTGANRCFDACSRADTACAAAVPEPFGAFYGGGPIGLPGLAAGNGTRHRSQRVDPKAALRGVPTEVGPGAQDTQREHDDTSHGVRFLSAR